MFTFNVQSFQRLFFSDSSVLIECLLFKLVFLVCVCVCVCSEHGGLCNLRYSHVIVMVMLWFIV